MIMGFFSKKENFLHSKEKRGNDFVSLSSHELRSPLSIVKWYTEILLDGDAGPLTEDQRKYLAVIESSNQRAIDIVRSLLNVSRLDLDTFSIKPEDTSVSSLVADVAELFQKEANKKNVTIIKEVKEGIRNISVDKHLCSLVLKTILSNAVTFSREGGEVNVVTTMLPQHEKIGEMTVHEESIMVTITDSGIGIPDKDKEKIFSKMFRASNVKDSEGSDSGLALYIAKTVLDYVGGKIWFTSIEKVGTTFYITFPTRGMKKKEGTTTLD